MPVRQPTPARPLPVLFSRLLSMILLPLWAAVAWAEPPAVVQGTEGWLFPGWEFNSPADPKPAIGLIAQAKALLAKDQIQLVLALAPSKIRLHGEHLRPDRRPPDSLKPYFDQLLRGLSQAGVDTVDLRAAMLADKDQHPQFHKTDSHWTVHAAQASAGAVAEKLRPRLGPPASGSTPPPLDTLISRPQYGDLVALQGIAADDPGRPQESVLAYKESNPAYSLLDEEPHYEVMLVGTSFAHPQWGFSQNLARQLGRPVGLTFRNGNYGHWNILLGYLRGAEFKAHRPRIIVWQINESALATLPDAAVWQRSQVALSAEGWLQQLKLALP